jgi:protein-S-isoprenylcysteine O-methyltransferase Ste14
MNKSTIMLKKVRLRGAWLVFLFSLDSAHHEMSWLGIGIATCGMLLRLWASGHIRKNREVTASGPYAYTRNPLYLGSLIMGIGFCLAISNYFLLGAIIILFGMIYYPTILAEESKLQRRYGEKYLAYLEMVPRLIPRSLTPKSHAEKKFSWQRVRQNREYRAVLGFLAVLFIYDVITDIDFPHLLDNIQLTALLKDQYPWLFVSQHFNLW